jgi:hypothetical protein
VRVRLVLVVAIGALFVVLFAGCGGSGGDDRAKVEANLQRFLATPERSPGLPVGGGPPRVKDHSCFKVEGSHAVLRLISAKDLPPGMKVALPPGGKVVLAPGGLVLAAGMKFFAPPGWRSLGTAVSASNWNCVVKIGTSVAVPVVVTVEDENNEVLMAGPRLPNTQSKPRIYQNACNPKPRTRTQRSSCAKVEPGSVSPAG